MTRYPDEQHDDSRSDVLDNAVTAMQQMKIPDGPTADVEAQLIDRVCHQADAQPHRNPVVRMIMNKSIARYAAMLVAGVALVVVAIGVFGGNSPAFADIKQKIIAAHTLTCQAVMTFTDPKPGQPKSLTIHMTAKNPGWLRQDMSIVMPGQDKPMDVVSVVSYREGKILNLVPQHKQAVLMSFDLRDFGQQPQNFNIVTEFTKMDDRDGRYVGRKELEGREMLVYEVRPKSSIEGVEGMDFATALTTMKLWVDAETLLPYRMVLDMAAPMAMKATFTDFAWDVDVDESKLTLDIPEGYQKREMNVSGVNEDDLVKCLRQFAALNEDRFPDQFGQNELQTLIVKYAEKNLKDMDPKQAEQHMMEIGQQFARGFMFVATFAEGGEFKYQGKGVALGDTSKVIAYFRTKDATNYRAILGDLSVVDSTADQLK